MLKHFVKLIRALSSNTAPAEIAHAFACGVMLGFLPKGNLLWLILFVFIFFMRIQRGVLVITMFASSMLTIFVDPIFHSVGYKILTAQNLIPFYTKALNVPFVSFLMLHNTVVIGSLVCSLAIYIPLFIVAMVFVWLWRKIIGEWVKNSSFVKTVSAVVTKIPLVRKITEIVQGLED